MIYITPVLLLLFILVITQYVCIYNDHKARKNRYVFTTPVKTYSIKMLHIPSITPCITPYGKTLGKASKTSTPVKNSIETNRLVVTPTKIADIANKALNAVQKMEGQS